MSSSHLVLYMFKSDANFPLQASSPSSLKMTTPFLLVVKSKNLGNLFISCLPPPPVSICSHIFLMICQIPSPWCPHSILLQLLLILSPKSISNVTTSFPSLASTFFKPPSFLVQTSHSASNWSPCFHSDPSLTPILFFHPASQKFLQQNDFTKPKIFQCFPVNIKYNAHCG